MSRIEFLKLRDIQKRNTFTRCQGMKESTEPSLGKTQLVELLNVNSEISISHILKYLVENIDSMHEQMGNFRRNMEIIFKVK